MSMPVQKPGQSRQDYGTPKALIAAVERRWGPLAVDLAASLENKKALTCLTEAEDSLSVDWVTTLDGGIGWLNPPFANIEPWARKCREESQRGARIIMLSPASVGANWFIEHCEPHACIVPLAPRLCFQGCHVLFPKDHPQFGEPKCGGDTVCDGCATYPKDCCLTLWGNFPTAQPLRDIHPQYRSWRWDQ